MLAGREDEWWSFRALRGADIRGKGISMSSASYGLMLTFLGAGFALGWYANRAIAAHGDVKSTKAKIPGYRKSRHRNGVITILLAFVIGFVVLGLLHPHK
jgi:hypothetical protein